MTETFFGNDCFLVMVNGDCKPVYPVNGHTFTHSELQQLVKGEPVRIAQWGVWEMYTHSRTSGFRQPANAVAMMLVLKHTGVNDMVWGDAVVIKAKGDGSKDA